MKKQETKKSKNKSSEEMLCTVHENINIFLFSEVHEPYFTNTAETKSSQTLNKKKNSE